MKSNGAENYTELSEITHIQTIANVLFIGYVSGAFDSVGLALSCQ